MKGGVKIHGEIHRRGQERRELNFSASRALGGDSSFIRHPSSVPLRLVGDDQHTLTEIFVGDRLAAVVEFDVGLGRAFFGDFEQLIVELLRSARLMRLTAVATSPR